MKRQVAGFTLVEVAIVMVIIGLLLGSVLKGQQILTNAKIKNLEYDNQGVMMAIYTYQERYSVLPGDDPYASAKFDSGVVDGQGDGGLNDLFNSTTETDDSRLLWSHLRAARLIAGDKTSTDLPIHAFNGVVGVSSSLSLTRTPLTISGMFVGFTNIPHSVALIIESHLDDNEPYKGTIQTDSMTGYDDTTTLHNLYFAW